MTQIILYPKLSTRSKRAILKIKKRYGRLYHYKPKGILLERLAKETGWTIDQVHDQLLRERAVLLKLKGIKPAQA